jgi:hypothetical protein
MGEQIKVDLVVLFTAVQAVPQRLIVRCHVEAQPKRHRGQAQCPQWIHWTYDSTRSRFPDTPRRRYHQRYRSATKALRCCGSLTTSRRKWCPHRLATRARSGATVGSNLRSARAAGRPARAVPTGAAANPGGPGTRRCVARIGGDVADRNSPVSGAGVYRLPDVAGAGSVRDRCVRSTCRASIRSTSPGVSFDCTARFRPAGPTTTSGGACAPR